MPSAGENLRKSRITSLKQIVTQCVFLDISATYISIIGGKLAL